MSDNFGDIWVGMLDGKGETSPPRAPNRPTEPSTRPALPEDTEAEKAFLSVVLAPGAGDLIMDAQSYMDSAYFHSPQHRLIWESAVQVANAGLEVSAISIRDQLGANQHRVGGFTGIMDLLSTWCDYSDPKPLAKILRSKWEARTAMIALDRAHRAISEEGIVGGNLDGMQTMLGALAPHQDKIVSHSDLLDLAASGSPLLPADLSGNKPFFGIGFIDDAMNATARRFGVIAAKTSAGKSSIAYQVCVESAKKGRRVLLVSLESDREEVAAALSANLSKLNRSDIMRYGSVGFDSDDLLAVKANVHGYYASSGSTWDVLERAIRSEHRRMAFDVVIVDYFTLLQPPEYKGRNLASLYGEISKAGKRLAQELSCSVIFLSQFNRGIEDGAEPHLENLRETGQLEQDADWVLLLWSKVEDEQDGTRIVYAKGGKNRGGRRGFSGAMTFFPAQSRFVERVGETKPVKITGKRMG